MSDKSLFARLQETYPTKTVEPYGEVIVVPSRAFKDSWKEQLEHEGVKTYVTGYGGQTCFFLRKMPQSQASAAEESPEQKPQQSSSLQEEPSTQTKPVTESEPSPATAKKKNWKPWSLEDRQVLKELVQKGVPIEEIAKRLDRSTFSIGAELRHIMPNRKPAKPKKKEDPKAIEPAAQPSPDDSLIKEFLEAASQLYPQHRRASAFLLKQVAAMMET